MELKIGDVLAFKEKNIQDIIITVCGIDCNRRVRYIYGIEDKREGYLFTDESSLLKLTKKLSKVEIALL